MKAIVLKEKEEYKGKSTIGTKLKVSCEGKEEYVYSIVPNDLSLDSVVGSEIIVKRNDKGFLLLSEETTEDIYNSFNKKSEEKIEEKEVTKNIHLTNRAIMAWDEWFTIEQVGRERMLKLGYSMEDVRAVTTGIRIQLK